MISTAAAPFSQQWMDAIIHSELALHPAGTAQDWYKLFFQAVFGPGHAIASAQQASDFLQQELIKSAQFAPWDLQPIGRYVRVNLQMCNTGAITAQELIDAFINSVEPPPLDAPQWLELWLKIVTRIQHLHPAASEYDFAETFCWAETRQMCSHSTQFRQAYHPHYRVVKQELL
jgi:hypothetical protein